jgi:sugar phosphate isomerase/epimerase
MAMNDINFQYCLNTSTIMGQKLSVPRQVEVAAAAGFTAIEPWIGDLAAYRDQGGSLQDLKCKIADLGLTVPNAIGFARWIVDDPAERARGLEEARRDFALVQQIGGTHMAAAPMGATEQQGMDLRRIAERYRQLLDLGQAQGVTAMLEFWGHSRTLGRLGEAAQVAMESGHPRACLLADVYHLYKGGSPIEGLRLLGARAIPVFHFNDYPDMPREQITDADRLWPGQGIAPIASILSQLKETGAQPVLSLELFNRQYWQMDALETARTGLARLKQVVEANGSPR